MTAPLRVLVTGASGNIGQCAVDALKRAGATVITTSRSGINPEGREASDIKADLLEPTEREKLIAEANATHLLHLAWVTDRDNAWTTPENIRWLSASADLLKRFADHGGHRAVVAGTCAEYDWTDLPGTPIPESASINPQSRYGASKASLHAIGAGIGTSGGSAGDGLAPFQYAFGRIFHTYGAGEARGKLVPHIAASLAEGKTAKCGPGAFVRDYLDFRDVGAALSCLVHSEVEGAVNIGSGVGNSVDHIADTLISIAGGTGKVETGQLEQYSDAPVSLIADVTRLRDEVGFVPKISLSQGLTEAYAYWKNQSA